MKKIIAILTFLILCSAVQSYAVDPKFIGLMKQTAVAKFCTNEANDICIDYESNSDCTDGELEKTDNSASSFTYGITDASSKLSCVSTTQKKNGSKSMSHAGSAIGYLTVAAAYNSISGGFWFNVPNLADWGGSIKILEVMNSVPANPAYIAMERAGTSTPRFYVYTNSQTTIATDVTAGNWYWVAWKYVKNDKMYLGVYDSTGTQISNSPISGTEATNTAAATIRWGNDSTVAGVSYIDDFAIDFTNAEFPLTPY